MEAVDIMRLLKSPKVVIPERRTINGLPAVGGKGTWKHSYKPDRALQGLVHYMNKLIFHMLHSYYKVAKTIVHGHDFSCHACTIWIRVHGLPKKINSIVTWSSSNIKKLNMFGYQSLTEPSEEPKVRIELSLVLVFHYKQKLKFWKTL